MEKFKIKSEEINKLLKERKIEKINEKKGNSNTKKETIKIIHFYKNKNIIMIKGIFL